MSLLKKLAHRLRVAGRTSMPDLDKQNRARAVARAIVTREAAKRTEGQKVSSSLILGTLVTISDLPDRRLDSFDNLIIDFVRHAAAAPFNTETLKVAVASLVPSVQVTVDRLVSDGRLVMTDDGLRLGPSEL